MLNKNSRINATFHLGRELNKHLFDVVYGALDYCYDFEAFYEVVI